MPTLVKITPVGDKELMKRINALGVQGAKAARKVLYRKAEKIAGEAKGEVPVDTGALKSTIHVEMDDDGAAIVAGGPAAGYAVYVHEDLTARHPVGGPKYIERPFLQELPSIAPAILAELDKLAKGK
jgi:hypothetical protein